MRVRPSFLGQRYEERRGGFDEFRIARRRIAFVYAFERTVLSVAISALTHSWSTD